MGGNERKSKKEGDERGERKQSEAGLGKRELDGRKRGSTNGQQKRCELRMGKSARKEGIGERGTGIRQGGNAK
jgi:hypothetical protein